MLRALEVELPKLDSYLEAASASGGCGSVVYDADMLAALTARYQRREPKAPDAQVSFPVFSGDERCMLDLIFKKFNERFALFAPEVRERARAAIDKTIRGNHDKQMPLMAYYTKQAFGKNGEGISDDIVAEMGLANIFFWTAFIIYDDFWDEDESSDPKMLSIANIFARHYTSFFSTLLGEGSGFRNFFHTLMDDLDAANAWETEHCRTRVEGTTFFIPEVLPDYDNYEKKYRPASGHILGSVAELVMLGYALNTPTMQSLIDYFKHYLIVMQLNDDAHDWEEDIARGHLSTVVVLLLYDIKAEGWEKSTIDLAENLPELKKVFWFATMPKYIQLARKHAEVARQALASLDMLGDPAPLLRLITITESAALKAEKEHKDSEEFIVAYGDMIQ